MALLLTCEPVGWPDNRQLQISAGMGWESIVSLAQLHRIDLFSFSSTCTTRRLVTRFHVDLEEKFVLGKREGFEDGEKDCYSVHCAVTVAMRGISKSLEHNNLGECYGKAG